MTGKGGWLGSRRRRTSPSPVRCPAGMLCVDLQLTLAQPQHLSFLVLSFPFLSFLFLSFLYSSSTTKSTQRPIPAIPGSNECRGRVSLDFALNCRSPCNWDFPYDRVINPTRDRFCSFILHLLLCSDANNLV